MRVSNPSFTGFFKPKQIKVGADIRGFFQRIALDEIKPNEALKAVDTELLTRISESRRQELETVKKFLKDRFKL